MYNEQQAFVEGRWVDVGGPNIDVQDPSTEQSIGLVASSNLADVERAVLAARIAFDEGPWPRMHRLDRRAALLRVADALERHQGEMSERLVADLGCPVSQVRGFQVSRSIDFWRIIAELAGSEDHLQPAMPTAHSMQPSLVAHEPVGVVGAITAYNYPFMIATWKIGPALAAGCTVVWKPNETVPLIAYEIMRAAEEADLPPGVLNLVMGGPEVGEALVTNPGVDAISFTGSVPTGEAVLRGAAGGIKKVVLELGGKSPAIVMDDADVDDLVPKVTYGYLLNTGQACAATTRLLVHASLYDEVVEKVCMATAAVPVGDPRDPKTVVGPLVSRRQLDRVNGYVNRVADEGGKLAVGGGRPPGLDVGHFIAPAVVVGLDNQASVVREEIFGPVLTILPFGDDDDAIRIANDTPFGLAAVLFGKKPSRTQAMARAIRAGTICINSGTFNPLAPIGGYKQSGLGRENGTWGLNEFRELKHISWA
jgi:acyl-CoA reductase-like NAD-dependent aldehyde dehydrogenase